MRTKKTQAAQSVTRPMLERLYIIDREIASGKYPNTNDLVERLTRASPGEHEGGSTATVSRDIAFMRDQLNAPIEYDTVERGYYYSRKTFRLPGAFMNAEDFMALGMARSILTLYRDTPFFDAANRLLETIMTPVTSSGMPANSDGARDWVEKRIVVPKIASAKIDRDVWDVIVAGLKENRVVAFDYLGSRDEGSLRRRVHPYQLLFDSGVWYLYGFSEERGATRVFSLPRIAGAELAGAVFTLPKNYCYADFSGDSYFGVFIGQERMHFAVDCYNEAAIFATDREWAADQKTSEIDGGLKLEFTSTQYDKVLRWTLSCGCNAIPQEPERLVKDWKWHAKEMRKLAAR